MPVVLVALAIHLLIPLQLAAQREARPDDFLGVTTCEAGAGDHHPQT